MGDSLPLERQHRKWFAQIGWRHLHAFALFAFAAFVSFSIAGAHISLGLLTLCVIIQSVKRRGQSAEGKAQKAEGKITSQDSSIRLGIEWPIIAFALVALVSTALSETPLASFRNLRHLLTILGAYAVALSLRQYPEWRRPLLWTFISVATVAALYGLGKFALGFSRKVQSTQGTTMTWGALSVMFMAVTLQMALAAPSRRERWLARAQIIPQIFSLLFSLVRGAYIGFFASAVYLLRQYWSKRRILLQRLLPAFLILLLASVFSPTVRQRVVAIFDLNTPSTQVRLIQWNYALQIVADHPVVGVGWRDLQPVIRRYATPAPNIPEYISKDVFSIGHFHSTYVTILVCFGVAGFLAFAWLMISVWQTLGMAMKHANDESRRSIIFASRAAMIGFLVAGIFDWTFGDAEVVTMLWFVIGMGLGQGDSAPSSSPVSSPHVR
ncbi:MAG: O-antigen ligase family protein [bacterium]